MKRDTAFWRLSIVHPMRCANCNSNATSAVGIRNITSSIVMQFDCFRRQRYCFFSKRANKFCFLSDFCYFITSMFTLLRFSPRSRAVYTYRKSVKFHLFLTLFKGFAIPVHSRKTTEIHARYVLPASPLRWAWGYLYIPSWTFIAVVATVYKILRRF